MRRIRAIAAACAGLALFIDLRIENVLVAVKGNTVLVPGLLNFAQTWNRGVSFGLLWQNGDVGRYALIAVLALVVIGVGTLAWRAANVVAATGYGLIVGGALGNLSDRILHGTVFDYLFVHVGRVPLFVCNFPDIVISAGAILIVAENLLIAKAGQAVQTD